MKKKLSFGNEKIELALKEVAENDHIERMLCFISSFMFYSSHLVSGVSENYTQVELPLKSLVGTTHHEATFDRSASIYLRNVDQFLSLNLIH